jgi:hypothetical protein
VNIYCLKGLLHYCAKRVTMTIEEYFIQFFSLDLNLKDGTRGDYRLESFMYKKGVKFTLIPDNFQSLLMGDSYKEIQLESDFRYYDLFKNNQRIMCNSPVIMYEQYLPYVKSRGKVLLGGLGLGIIPRLMCLKESVEKVTVIELSKEVIDLCSFTHNKLEIINGDCYSFIRNTDLSAFDYMYVDAYTSEGKVYEEIIIPTRKFLYANYPTIPVDFWEEDQLKINYALKNGK